MATLHYSRFALMSRDKLEIQFVLFAMLRIDYKCNNQLTLICLADCVVLMRKERSEGAVLVVWAMLFVISIIYLASTQQAAADIWLMIMWIHIRLVSHVLTLTSSVNQSSSIFTSLSEDTFKSDVNSFIFPYSPKVNNFFSWPVISLLTPWRCCARIHCVVLILYPSGN